MAARSTIANRMTDVRMSVFMNHLQGSEEAFAGGADGNFPGLGTEPDGSVTEGINATQTKMGSSKGALEAQLICCLGHLHSRRYLNGCLVNDLPGYLPRCGPE